MSSCCFHTQQKSLLWNLSCHEYLYLQSRAFFLFCFVFTFDWWLSVHELSLVESFPHPNSIWLEKWKWELINISLPRTHKCYSHLKKKKLHLRKNSWRRKTATVSDTHERTGNGNSTVWFCRIQLSPRDSRTVAEPHGAAGSPHLHGARRSACSIMSGKRHFCLSTAAFYTLSLELFEIIQPDTLRTFTTLLFKPPKSAVLNYKGNEKVFNAYKTSPSS